MKPTAAFLVLLYISYCHPIYFGEQLKQDRDFKDEFDPLHQAFEDLEKEEEGLKMVGHTTLPSRFPTKKKPNFSDLKLNVDDLEKMADFHKKTLELLEKLLGLTPKIKTNIARRDSVVEKLKTIFVNNATNITNLFQAQTLPAINRVLESNVRMLEPIVDYNKVEWPESKEKKNVAGDKSQDYEERMKKKMTTGEKKWWELYEKEQIKNASMLENVVSKLKQYEENLASKLKQYEERRARGSKSKHWKPKEGTKEEKVKEAAESLKVVVEKLHEKADTLKKINSFQLDKFKEAEEQAKKYEEERKAKLKEEEEKKKRSAVLSMISVLTEYMKNQANETEEESKRARTAYEEQKAKAQQQKETFEKMTAMLNDITKMLEVKNQVLTSAHPPHLPLTDFFSHGTTKAAQKKMVTPVADGGWLNKTDKVRLDQHVLGWKRAHSSPH